MKTTYLHLTLLLIGANFLTVNAQSDVYFPTKTGTKFEVTTYDKKNSITAVSKSEVVQSDAKSVIVHIVNTDKKGKEVLNTKYEAEIKENEIVIDQKTLVKNEISSRMTDPSIRINVSGTNSSTPNTLSVGQKLPDNEIRIEIMSSLTLNFNMKTFNREVVGSEKITVPAGTFDCVVVSSSYYQKMLTASNKTKKTWLAKGIGVVKQETYSSGSKLESTELLTMYKE